MELVQQLFALFLRKQPRKSNKSNSWRTVAKVKTKQTKTRETSSKKILYQGSFRINVIKQDTNYLIYRHVTLCVHFQLLLNKWKEGTPSESLVFIIFQCVLWKTLTFTKFIVHNSHITVSWCSKIQPSWVHNWKHKCWAPISSMYTCQVIFIMYSRNVIRDLKKRKRWCTGFCPLTLIHDKSRLRD